MKETASNIKREKNKKNIIRERERLKVIMNKERERQVIKRKTQRQREKESANSIERGTEIEKDNRQKETERHTKS